MLLLFRVPFAWGSEPAVIEHDLVIVGGSTASLAAAFAAAEEGVDVALLEPTDWIGGQITSSGVPAIDEAWHKVEQADGTLLNVATIARDRRNMTPWLRDVLTEIGNPGGGWVSRYCFEPRVILDDHFHPREQQLSDTLTIYREAVIKEAAVAGRRVTGVTVIQRTLRAGSAESGYARLPSQAIPDWYDTTDSEQFTKKKFILRAKVFVDASEWGELLALSGAPFSQGVDKEDGTTASKDRCGQAITFGFVQRLHAEPVEGHPQFATVPGLGLGMYRGKENAWQQIWTYRRLLGSGKSANVGDLSLQNWGYSLEHDEGGNDYPFGYLFLSVEGTSAARADWQGGVDLQVMAEAEKRALAWHDWFRRAAPPGIDPDSITLAGDVLGTEHGLSKLPYIRDTRRSIGVDRFQLAFADLISDSEKKNRTTGRIFDDTIALGAYPSDIHRLVGCEYVPGILENHPTLPFCIPLRALTNEGFDNLLVAGKTMAQTFLANSATRLHPIEWSSGTACGVVAAEMVKRELTTRSACEDYARIRKEVARHTPVVWHLEP